MGPTITAKIVRMLVIVNEMSMDCDGLAYSIMGGKFLCFESMN